MIIYIYTYINIVILYIYVQVESSLEGLLHVLSRRSW